MKTETIRRIVLELVGVTTVNDKMGELRIMRRWLWPLVLLWSMMVSCSDKQSPLTTGQNLCRVDGERSGESGLMLASEARYRTTDTYGLAEDEWIAALGGISVDEQQRLYVYDRGDPRILVLSDRLVHLRSFGREGHGPGELSPPYRRFGVVTDWSFNLIDVSDSEVAVYDGEGIEVFGVDGTFRRHIKEGLATSNAYGVRFVSIGSDQDVWYALDVVEAFGDLAPRTFQTWQASIENRSMVWELPLEEPITVTFGRGFQGRFDSQRQARPLWGKASDCVLVLDGTSPWLWIIDVKESRVDSLRLPGWDVPAAGTLPSDFQDPERLRRISAVLELGKLRPGPPTALKRWAELAIDPVGHVWIKLWELDGHAGVPVMRIDVNAGIVEQGRLPAFPRAFGAHGVFYAVNWMSKRIFL